MKTPRYFPRIFYRAWYYNRCEIRARINHFLLHNNMYSTLPCVYTRLRSRLKRNNNNNNIMLCANRNILISSSSLLTGVAFSSRSVKKSSYKKLFTATMRTIRAATTHDVNYLKNSTLLYRLHAQQDYTRR